MSFKSDNQRKAYWVKNLDLKKGGLSKQLKIPEPVNIPITLLEKIKNAKIGDTINNPTNVGIKKIKVTPLLKKRAVLAHTFKTKMNK